MNTLPDTSGMIRYAFLVVLLSLTRGAQGANADLASTPLTASIPFLANQGQIEDPGVAFALPLFSGAVAVMQDGALRFRLPGSEGPVQFGMRFLNAGDVHPQGINPSPARFSHIKGDDPARWQPHLNGFQAVSLGDLYDGIALILQAGNNNMEKVFTIAPGYTPAPIRIRLEGASHLAITPDGELKIQLESGHVFLSKPYAFQSIEGHHQQVPAGYRILAQDEFGYRTDAYDPAYPLVIDPLLTGTFLGGSKVDEVNAVTVQSGQSVYVAGTTASTDFPVSTNTGAVLRNDVFISKFNRDLRELQASVLIGGNGHDVANAIALRNGILYVAGHTESANFPAMNTYGSKGQRDAFVLKIETNLTNLLASARIGEKKGISTASDLAFATNGDVLITGHTSATELPFVPLPEAELKHYNAYVAAFSNDLTLANTLVFGGSSKDIAYSLAVADNGNILVGGVTSSTNLPTDHAIKTQLGGLADGFVALIDSSYANLLALTYFGGNGLDAICAMEKLPGGRFAIAGETASSDFPVKPQAAIQTGLAGGADAFVAILGTEDDHFTLERSTYLGGSGNDEAKGLAIRVADGLTHIYLTGSTTSDDFPGTALGIFTNRTGVTDAFVARLDGSLTNQFEATYLGGSQNEEAVAIALDEENWHVLVGGWTESTDFPIWQNAFDNLHNGGRDGFVSILPARLRRANIASLGHTNWIVIADAGNAADIQVTTNTVVTTTDTGDIQIVHEVVTQLVGRVDYEFRMSTYTVNNRDYADFLNTMSLPPGITLPHAYLSGLGLYTDSMEISVLGGISNNYTYSTYKAKEGQEDDPVTFVSYYTACRYANWLHHGSPTNEPGNWTETGAYRINEGSPPRRQPGAMVSLPTVDEWHKAAYYKGGGTDAGYWMYPTASDEPPTAAPDDPATNNVANYNFILEAPTDCRAYTNSRSPYGTVNQGGNTWEWVEPDPQDSPDNKAAIRGGSYLSPQAYDLSRLANERQDASNTVSGIGIRLIWHEPE